MKRVGFIFLIIIVSCVSIFSYDFTSLIEENIGNKAMIVLKGAESPYIFFDETTNNTWHYAEIQEIEGDFLVLVRGRSIKYYIPMSEIVSVAIK